jgi:hypothetical protein
MPANANAVPNSIVTPQTPRSASVLTNAAQGTFPPTTAPSNTFLLLTAGTGGGRLTRLRATPQTTIAAAVHQLFRSRDSGTTKFFVQGVTQGAVTVNSTTAAIPVDFGYSEDNPLVLGPNEQLYVACSVSTACVFDADYSDY